jgi:hypothetical protein
MKRHFFQMVDVFKANGAKAFTTVSYCAGMNEQMAVL